MIDVLSKSAPGLRLAFTVSNLSTDERINQQGNQSRASSYAAVGSFGAILDDLQQYIRRPRLSAQCST
jgi:hypothetical protein